jgi:serine/threonine-protein kinase HipA
MKCRPEFFGTAALPQVDISKERLEELAKDSISAGLTVPGVQKKLSIHLSDDHSSRLTLVGYPAGYILKPQTEAFSQLPEAEDLVMDIADMMGVMTVPHGLIDTDIGPAYITKRVDRKGVEKYAMEDFCQLNNRLTQDKYRSSYERCGGIIRRHSARVGFDLSEFYLRLVVCFVTGNSDMHLKNFSLIETEPGSREYVLSPAYDLMPANIILPDDKEETALALNGKKANLWRKDFMALADNIGLNRKAAESLIGSVLKRKDEAQKVCRESSLNEDMQNALIDLMETRCDRLK